MRSDDKEIELDGTTQSGLGLPVMSAKTVRIGAALVIAALLSSLTTFLVITGLTPVPTTDIVIYGLFFLNFVLICSIAGLLGWQAWGLARAWRNKVAGARIHVRIVALFTVIAALPALLLAAAATTTFSRALDNAFNNRTRTIVNHSLDVARAYFVEHGQVIRTDIVNMGKDIDDTAARITGDPSQSRPLIDLVTGQVGLRELSIAAIIDGKGTVVVQAASDTRVTYSPPSERIIAVAEGGNVPVLYPTDSNRVAAITKLANLKGLYLYGARSVDPRVVAHVRAAQDGVAEYEFLRRNRGIHKFLHGIMYFTLSLSAVMAAIWVGLWFASRLVAPIRRLIAAAQRVATGDLSVQLPIYRGEGDLRRLSKNFNNMTTELARQRRDIDEAREKIEERNRFMEAVLAGVSAGVIGIDAQRRITLVSQSAEKLLGRPLSPHVGAPLTTVVPELEPILAELGEGRIRPPDPIKIEVDGKERTIAVQVTSEADDGVSRGSVVTFDDVTELMTAQRSSAWGDVARRIAHEIKNPLTPIQLSAERLKRKYAGAIREDRETFEKLTDTIVRQVEDLKRMVNEFAEFARMPKPQIQLADLRDAVQEPVIQYRETHPAIDYALFLPKQPVLTACDQRMIAQAVTNLTKNATEAIETAMSTPDKDPDYKGRVETHLKVDGSRILIEVIDN
ncbi:MAG TPA: HAMP domain-containing protein, partial [Hyphomicrobiaceae bacterium]|nr:HAMP domain-containing protein [Hyphomicrobiaceae bacterium]